MQLVFSSSLSKLLSCSKKTAPLDPRKRPRENDHKRAHSFLTSPITNYGLPKMAPNLKTCTNIAKMPVFIIFKGSSAIFVWANPRFYYNSLFKTAKNVKQIQCCSAQLMQTQ